VSRYAVIAIKTEKGIQMRLVLGCAVALAGLLTVQSVAAADRCKSKPLTAVEARRLQDRIFDVLTRDDLAAWKSQIAADFVAYENGKAYDGQEFFDLIAGAHKAGAKLVWSVSNDVADIDCELAVIHYVNTGSVGRPGEAAKPTKWLETSSFRRVGNEWRAFLVTSMILRE
jgi:hypothetical protein